MGLAHSFLHSNKRKRSHSGDSDSEGSDDSALTRTLHTRKRYILFQ